MPNVRIKLKETLSSAKANKTLAQLGWDEKNNGKVFHSRKDREYQFADYYSAPENSLDIPADEEKNRVFIKNSITNGEERPVTFEECEQRFGCWMQVNESDVDISYSRTEDKDMLILILFVLGNKQHIQYIKDGIELLERSSLIASDEEKEVFNSLELPDETIELLPEEDRTDRSIQGGVAKMKYWGTAPQGDFVHIAFGNVKDTTFMKDKQHVNPVYDSLYRCDDKKGVLLVPQIPFDQKAQDIAMNSYKAAYDMGVREHIFYYILMIWSNCFLLPSDDSKLIKETAHELSLWYTTEELQARMEEIGKKINDHYPDYHRITYNPTVHSYHRFGYGGKGQNSLVGLLNCFSLALFSKSPKTHETATNNILSRETTTV